MEDSKSSIKTNLFVPESYINDLVSFLHSIKWVFCVLNTQYLNQDIINENRKYLELLNNIDLNNLPELTTPQNNHPEWLQNLIKNVNSFVLSFDVLKTDSWNSTPVRKMKIKKQYEIENVSKVIHSICGDEVTQLVDFGSGLGYLGHFLFERFGYNVLGLEGSDDRVERAIERQKKFHPSSIGKVQHVQHFITPGSTDFIQSHLEDKTSQLAIFGLHGCGDLTLTAIELFLNMDRVKHLIFMPCCYHKMSVSDAAGENFNLFPLSNKLKIILEKYKHEPFLNRPFLRLAGQQSPSKWKDMSKEDHWIHGKNMFERALVQALLDEDESMKRVNNISFAENRVTMEEIIHKYQLFNKSSGKSKEWSAKHYEKFRELRETKFADGEEMSENLFCLQTVIQSSCENLVLMDRIQYIQEEGTRRKLNLKINVKKLQNDKLSPRCLILIVEKL